MKTTAIILSVLLAALLANHFILNYPENWGNYEACLDMEKGVSLKETLATMGEPDFVSYRDDGSYDVGYIYNRYEFASSGPILIKLSKQAGELRVVGSVCEDIW